VKRANEGSAWISVCSNKNYVINYKIAMDLILISHIITHM